MEVEEAGDRDSILVKGRGEFQLAILIDGERFAIKSDDNLYPFVDLFYDIEVVDSFVSTEILTDTLTDRGERGYIFERTELHRKRVISVRRKRCLIHELHEFSIRNLIRTIRLTHKAKQEIRMPS